MYMTLATADATGRPWVSPVWFATGSDETFLWVSAPETRHSRNIAVRPEVAIVIFDSTVSVGGAEALYVDAIAEEVAGDASTTRSASTRTGRRRAARASGRPATCSRRLVSGSTGRRRPRSSCSGRTTSACRLRSKRDLQRRRRGLRQVHGAVLDQLSAQLADLAGVEAGQRAVDVGCGPGALLAELERRLGADAVAAADPSEPSEAARARHPGVDVRIASAEDLPFEDDAFDAALAQLVVHFMADPIAGLMEMARVTRPGGVVAACVWDLAGGRAPISPFWQAARELDPDVEDESYLAGARAGHLVELFRAAGLHDVEESEISSTVEYGTFEEWWQPYTLGVGPAGAYARSLDDDQLAELRERCRRVLPAPPFALTAYAWAARGRA